MVLDKGMILTKFMSIINNSNPKTLEVGEHKYIQLLKTFKPLGINTIKYKSFWPFFTPNILILRNFEYLKKLWVLLTFSSSKFLRSSVRGFLLEILARCKRYKVACAGLHIKNDKNCLVALDFKKIFKYAPRSAIYFV